MTQINDVFIAYLKAIRSQLSPKMLALLIGPMLISVVFWVLLLWFLWTPMTHWIDDWLFDSDGMFSGITAFLNTIGLGAAKSILPGLMTFMFTFPIMIALALIFIAIVSMPVVIRHLSATEYSDLGRRGNFSVSTSAWNVLKAGVIFIVGYLITMPLWLIPPLALVVPLLWWGWLNSRIMRFDSLVEHASVGERRSIIMQNRPKYYLLGVMVAILNYIPPLFIVAPVFSALAFGHFSLKALRDFRRRDDTLIP
jgi:uncharacterized protein involved in cysteine biosynthesis